MHQSPDYITVKKLAELLGMDRSHARRYVLKLGISAKKRRTPDSGNQLALTVSKSEMEVILKRRREEGFLNEGKAVSNEHGFFYVIQLVPDLDPKRVKLGFAIDINERLTQHRTAAPTAICLRSWPCRRAWESSAIDCLTKKGCRLVANEVFECDDVDHYIIERGDAFFELMPDPKSDIGLAENSPLGQFKSYKG